MTIQWVLAIARHDGRAEDEAVTTGRATGAVQVIERLQRATDAHDLDALVACFAPDMRNETPIHPARGFTGSEQVRRNWSQIFAAVPDLRATVQRLAVDDDTAWAEWEMRGTRPDGTPHLMRGVTIAGVADGRIAWIRFYLEPVDTGTLDVDGAVRQAVGAAPTGPGAG